MPNLIVTFSHGVLTPPRAPTLPLSVGSAARTETIEIGAESVVGDEAATPADTIVELVAEASCWYAIGEAPVAEAGAGRRLLEGDRAAHWVRPGERVAVIEGEV